MTLTETVPSATVAHSNTVVTVHRHAMIDTFTSIDHVTIESISIENGPIHVYIICSAYSSGTSKSVPMIVTPVNLSVLGPSPHCHQKARCHVTESCNMKEYLLQ